jgi:small neutral amino acid transporter SnatA (MarC family)
MTSNINSKTKRNAKNSTSLRGKYMILAIILAFGLVGGSVALALQISLDSPATLPSDI